MDVKSLLEKYANTDEYAKRIFDKLLAQVERVEKEKKELDKWEKSILNLISEEELYVNLCVVLTTILLFILQLIICQFLGIDLSKWGLGNGMLVIDILISIGLWIFIAVKRVNKPQVNYTLISYDEITYLNGILQVSSIEIIKEYQLVIKWDHYYIYDESCNHLKIVDEYITDKNDDSVYLYQCYQIKKYDFPSTYGYDLDILKEHFKVNIEKFYSQKQMEKNIKRGEERWM